MSALTQLLGVDGWETLKQRHLGKQPYAVPGVAAGATRNLSWAMLDEALASASADVLVVRRGQSVSCTAPRSLVELRALFQDGIGIALRRADQASAPVRMLAQSLAEDMPGAQRVILFATPSGTHGFGWHFDAEEVFIVQTEGSKTYYLRANTVCCSRQPCDASFAAFSSETSPLLACELHAGDFLYVPSHWWHAAIAHSASLSVSVGVLPTASV